MPLFSQGIAMITSNSNYRTTLFYFNNVDQLRDFESFKICPVHAGQHIPDTEADKADYWCVIGIYKAEQARANKSPAFPVADLPTELYANLFAQLCRQLVSSTPDSASTKTLTKALQSQALTA